MAETVTSQFRLAFLLRAYVATPLLFFITILMMKPGYVFNEKTRQLEATSLTVLIAIGLILLTYFFVDRFLVKITTGPDLLEFYHPLTQQRKSVPYDKIVHVTALKAVSYSKYSGYPSVDRRLVIELSNGKLLSIIGRQYNNYDELKESIRRHRFHLD